MVDRHLLPLKAATAVVGLLLLAACRAGVPGAATTTEHPAFALDLDAPPTVTAGATFEITLQSDVPADDLLPSPSAVLTQDGKGIWVLLLGGGVERFPLPDDWAQTGKGFAGYGPWTFRAPPDRGIYEFCVNASAPGQSDASRNSHVTTCRPLEVVAAFPLALDAPDKVAVNEPFDLRFVTNVPAERLTSGQTANLYENEKDLKSGWLVTVAGDVVRSNPILKDHGPPGTGYRGYGPWTFHAPPEPGVYRLCKPASAWPEVGDKSLGYLSACTSIEVTPATAG